MILKAKLRVILTSYNLDIKCIYLRKPLIVSLVCFVQNIANVNARVYI